MNVFVSLLFSLVPVHAKPVSVDPSYAPRIQAACVNQIRTVAPEAIKKLNFTPEEYCECIASNHESWAQNDVGDARRAQAYLKAVLALWTPIVRSEIDRVHAKYEGEFENDANYTTQCNKK